MVRFKLPAQGQSYVQSLNDAAVDLAQKEELEIKSQQSSGLVLFQKSGADTQKLVKDLKNNPTVEMAQPNYIFYLPNSTSSWADVSGNVEDFDIDADDIWNEITGKGVIVAVLDSGVDVTQAELRPNIWTNIGETDCSDGIDNDANGYIDDCHGWDFTGDNALSPTPDNDPADKYGHGTNVAKIIAGANNGMGRVGIAPNATIMPLKVIDHTGFAPVSAIFEAIYYAMNNGADVINMSIGDPEFDPFEADAVAAAYKAGIVLVSSAGNEHSSTPKYPAAYPEVIAVSAVDSANFAAQASNYGEWIDLAAPGGYTSAAAPHVSATAALVLEKFPGASPAEIGNILRQSAHDLGATGKDDFYGYGLVDAYAALFPPRLTLLSKIPEVTDSATPAFTIGSTEAGAINFAGSCASSQTNVIDGETTIRLRALKNGMYSDCTFTVTDSLGNISDALALPSFAVAAILDSSGSPSDAEKSEFRDVHNHWGKTFVLGLVERNALTGYSDNTIRPDNPISRAEALKIALLAFDYPIITNVTMRPFVDVEEAAWYLRYIATAKEAKIVDGFADGTFRPNVQISRAEALKFISVAAGIIVADFKNEKPPFADVPVGAWYLPYINWAVKQAVVSGYSDGTFAPDNTITRAEFSKMVYLTLELLGR